MKRALNEACMAMLACAAGLLLFGLGVAVLLGACALAAAAGKAFGVAALIGVMCVEAILTMGVVVFLTEWLER